MMRIPAEASRPVRRAMVDLAQRLKVDQSEIALQKVVPATWPDASLGCPESDLVYAQVLTPGYVVFLSCGQKVYEYRTNTEGEIVVYVGPKDSDR